MRLSFVFSDWTRYDRKITGEENLDLSLRDFHGGTTFRGTLELDEDQAEELRGALAAGFTPTFWVSANEPSEDECPDIHSTPAQVEAFNEFYRTIPVDNGEREEEDENA